MDWTLWKFARYDGQNISILLNVSTRFENSFICSWMTLSSDGRFDFRDVCRDSREPC